MNALKDFIIFWNIRYIYNLTIEFLALKTFKNVRERILFSISFYVITYISFSVTDICSWTRSKCRSRYKTQRSEIAVNDKFGTWYAIRFEYKVSISSTWAIRIHEADAYFLECWLGIRVNLAFILAIVTLFLQRIFSRILKNDKTSK